MVLPHLHLPNTHTHTLHEDTNTLTMKKHGKQEGQVDARKYSSEYCVEVLSSDNSHVSESSIFTRKFQIIPRPEEDSEQFENIMCIS